MDKEELKAEAKERVEDFKEGAQDYKEDIKGFWKIDKKAVLITFAIAYGLGILTAVIFF